MTTHSVLRHEKKFPLSYGDYLLLRSSIACALDKDPHSDGTGTYFIRSIYYDTYDDGDYFTKLMGVHDRKKIRARIYDFSSNQVKIETKIKSGAMLKKVTTTVSKESFQNFHKGTPDPEQLGQYSSLLFLHYQEALRPVITIDYDREAYVHPFSNIRINFDKNIRWTNTNHKLFDPHLDTLPLTEDFYCLMEVKYDTYLPDWLTGLLNQAQTTQSSFSKYCSSRAIGG